MLSFLRTVKSVLWGFFGVRRGRGYDADIANNKPAPLILTGLLMAACLVVILVLVARWAVNAAL
ncbi:MULTISPECIES: DUF2970 domain-containing protein [Achromobacter]|jgi:hypothetical protein|uniref:DUF2970 domain-containing protein n=3 Tax=Achromobacter TaxID=222 RepID=A0AAD2QDL2_ACHAE|nr:MULTISPECIES: DUF2970 domain-containing protein [Achromobacter]ADP13874.1 hypothetical protein AXYL_00516 [Achromobacter xylosoxidans A8]MBD9383234.1 DUF2970 domain-containing protein [Achromobacter sp. ACM02]MBD9422637.1 DUF2970 domain-containing protein [Achromobacter sp. ACM04]MBD9430285.1 DUF2970 domain-containing protein [Achromobacter sp. ACM03]MDQ1760930.1 DUF2970 domain-containing protein [Achromobacter aegrifaciens]